MTWTLESGSHVLCNGGTNKNSKDDRVSRNKNSYTHQTLYGHLNSANQLAKVHFFLFRCNPGGSFDARHFHRFPYTFAIRRIVSDTNSPHTRLFLGMAKHARSFDSSTHSQAPEHTGPFAAQNYGSVQEGGSVSPLARSGRYRASRLTMMC